MNEKAERERTWQEKLSGLPHQRLVAIVTDMATNVDGAVARLETLLAAAVPAPAAQLARQRLAAIRRSKRHYWGSHGARELAAAYDEILVLIEDGLLATAPDQALAMAAAVIESDSHAFEHADDSTGQIGDVFRRACTLFGAAAARCASPAVLPLLRKLVTEDAYGARGTLLQETAQGLDETARAGLIAEYRPQLASGDEAVSRFASRALAAIAEAIGDPVLYEEATLHGNNRNVPVFRLRVAQHYLAAGRLDEAMARLPASAAECGGHAYEWEQTQIALLRALGRTSELREALWNQFRASPGARELSAWLDTAPAAEHPAMVERARAEVLADRHPPAVQARYFLEAGDTDTAARCIMARLEQCQGEYYEQVVPLAQQLAEAHPLAASALYRKLLEANLAQGLSKYYSHGVRYWRALQTLAPKVDHWGPLPPHEMYVTALRAQHARKPAFWAKLGEPTRQ